MASSSRLPDRPLGWAPPPSRDRPPSSDSWRGRGQSNGRGSTVRGGPPGAGGRSWSDRGGRPGQTTFGAPSRSLPPGSHGELSRPSRGGGWTRQESRNAERSIDPMSLVASPSRGLDDSNGPSLLSLDFQLSFHARLRRLLVAHRGTFPSPNEPLEHQAFERAALRPDKEREEHVRRQIESAGLLVLEWRKLREGVVASGRRDAFAIQVYEESAELALEALDWSQLGSLLPTLVTDLHPSERSSEPSLDARLADLQLVPPAPEEQPSPAKMEDRHAMFAAMLLLLPVCTRLHLTDFCATFTSLVASSGVRRDHAHIVFAWRVFLALRRGRWTALHQLIADTGIVSAFPNAPAVMHHGLVFPLLPLVRRRIVLPVVRKAYFQLADLSYASRCLQLDFDVGPDDRHGRAQDEVKTWMVKVGGVSVADTGVIVFREPTKRAAPPAT